MVIRKFGCLTGRSADEGDNPFDNPNIQPTTQGSSLKIRF